jgi:hypothetical protein
VGPSVVRLLLAHLGLASVEDLVKRYGDPSAPDAPSVPSVPVTPQTPKEEAIVTAVRFAPGTTEDDVRAIANDFDSILAHAPAIEWLETLLREVQRRILIPNREQRDVARRRRSTQRTMRNLHEAAHAEPAAPAAAKPAKKPAAR